MLKIYELIKKNKTLSIICAVILGLGSLAMLYSFVRNILDICDVTTLLLAIMVGAFCVILIWATVCVIINLIKEKSTH